MKKRVGIWIRVSTEDQAQGDSLNADDHNEQTQQQQRPIGDCAPAQPFDEEPQQNPRSNDKHSTAQQPKEAQWFVGEPGV